MRESYTPEVNPDGSEKHITQDGARFHVLSWSTAGTRCSAANCEVNRPRPATAAASAVVNAGATERRPPAALTTAIALLGIVADGGRPSATQARAVAAALEVVAGALVEVSDDDVLKLRTAAQFFESRTLTHIADRLERVRGAAPCDPAPAAVAPPATPTTAAALLACAEAWEPEACLLGNVRARDVAALCRAVLARPANDAATAAAAPTDTTRVDAIAQGIVTIECMGTTRPYQWVEGPGGRFLASASERQPLAFRTAFDRALGAG